MTRKARSRSAAALLGAVVALAQCGSRDPYARNLVVPVGSIYVEPAEEVKKLGYGIAHVDTIIGYIEAYRFHGGPGSEADRLVVDVFTAIATGRRVVSVTAQSFERVRPAEGFRRIVGQPTTLSLQARADAAKLMSALGCETVETEQHMTVDGIELEAWCAGERRTHGSR